MVLFWLLLLYLGCAIRGVFNWISSSSAGLRVSGSLSVFAGGSSVSARSVGEPGDCGSGVSRAEEAYRLRVEGPGDNHHVRCRDSLGVLLDLRSLFPLMSTETSVLGGKAAGT